MATSFDGWGSSWAHTWDRVTNPNAMYGSASIVFSAIGTLTDVLDPSPPTEEPRLGGFQIGPIRQVKIKSIFDKFKERQRLPRSIKKKVKKTKAIAQQVADTLQSSNDISSPIVISLFEQWAITLQIEQPDASDQVAFFEQVAIALKAIKEEQDEEESILALLLA